MSRCHTPAEEIEQPPTIHRHKWHEIARSYTQPCSTFADMCFPKRCFVFHRDVNDTELPGVESDLKRVTLSVLWKPMLSNFYREIEYGKWASKVMHQHAAHTRQDLIQHALSVRDASDEGNRRWLEQQLRATMNKADDKDGGKTEIIRIMRFKRMLERTECREKGIPGAIDDSHFAVAGMAKFVDSVKYALERDRSDDEDSINDIEERGRECFYDGMRMEFDGRGELNEPGIASDNDEEWEDEDD